MHSKNMQISKIKILIADDHAVMREGLRMLLERELDFEVVAEAGDGEEVIRLTNIYKPDLIILDVGMPKLSGLDIIMKIKKNYPTVFVLVLTIHDEGEYITGLLEAGANGYLMKSIYGIEILNAIRSICAGDIVLHPIVVKKLLDYTGSHKFSTIDLDNVESLTPREIAILKLTARGISNREIAREIDISVRAVKGHLVNIFSKMNVNSRTKAVVYALQRGLIDFEEIDEEVTDG